MARKSKKTKTAQAVAVAPELPRPSAAEQNAIIRAKARCDARGPRAESGLNYDPATGGIAVGNPHTDHGGWLWGLGRRCSSQTEGAHVSNVSTFVEFEHLRQVVKLPSTPGDDLDGIPDFLMRTGDRQ